jgi:hypothetical protein
MMFSQQKAIQSGNWTTNHSLVVEKDLLATTCDNCLTTIHSLPFEFIFYFAQEYNPLGALFTIRDASTKA